MPRWARTHFGLALTLSLVAVFVLRQPATDTGLKYRAVFGELRQMHHPFVANTHVLEGLVGWGHTSPTTTHKPPLL